jgi:tRNA A37 threonylcarbamoyladenosine dehydratase
MRYQRCRLLLGEEDFAKLQNVNILILGVGGVGSYALDCLYRSGVANITIVDYDIFEESNQNRQIGSDAVGEYKTEALVKLYPGVTAIKQKIDMTCVETFDFDPYDLVIDAADTTKVKVEIAK